jgi:ligand-binding sensor domain-containing protein/DNA-binding CsgD family transcriptional regulator
MVSHFRQHLFVTLILALLPGVPAMAQVKNRGIPHIINYPKKVYGGGPQNWSIAQDPRGFLYVGNNDGILEFDGRRWKKYALPDRFMYRAVAVGKEGTVWVGLTNDFGKLVPDDKGLLVYESLSEKFPDIATSFNDIWKIYDTPEGVYFQAKNKIFRYTGGNLEVILPDREFNFLFRANSALYVAERQRGLLLVSGTRAVPAPGGDLFAGKSVESVVSYDESRVIIGTANHGIYLYDGQKAVPWATGLQGFLMENSIFCGTQINNRYFAFGTIRDGVLILDRNGQAVQHINQAKGLQNNTVLSIFTDSDNNLWLGLDQGISFIEVNSPFSFYSYGQSLPGTGYASEIKDGLIYAGTNQGLFVKEWKSYEDPLDQTDRFRLVPGTQGQVWTVKNIGNSLLCGHNMGTFSISGNQAKLISDIQGGWDYEPLNGRPDLMIGGTYTGIVLFEKKGSDWQFNRALRGFHESTRLFAQDADGSIWVAHGDLGIFRLMSDTSLSGFSRVRTYNESDGLPSRYRNSLFKINNQILFATNQGIYRYNKVSDSFEPDVSYQALLGKDLITCLSEDREGHVWFFKPREIGVIHTQGGEIKNVEKRPFYPIAGLLKGNFEHVNVVDDSNIIFASEEGLIHYDPAFPMKYPESRGCFIRSLVGTGSNTRTFFGGAAASGQGTIRIPYSHHDIRIEFAAPFFDNPDQMLFSYYLEEYDPGQSEWITESAKDYTGLHEGVYTFHVRAKNIYQIETAETTLRFRVLPPWYRGVPMIIVYILLSLSAAFIAARILRKRMHRDRQTLAARQEREIELTRQQFAAESLEAEKKLVQLEKEKFESEMDHKNRQLASSIGGLLKKNEFLIQLKDDLYRIAQAESTTRTGEKLSKIISRVDENIENTGEDDQFEDHFDAVHDNFLKTLKKQYPQLTPKDLRLCAYLRMNLSTKEIAPLMNISPRGVEISRYRLRKRMNLPHDINLTDFMLNI